ncbi:hypothetical protein pb186bvf_005976 [Paramecium bursaria]
MKIKIVAILFVSLLVLLIQFNQQDFTLETTSVKYVSCEDLDELSVTDSNLKASSQLRDFINGGSADYKIRDYMYGNEDSIDTLSVILNALPWAIMFVIFIFSFIAINFCYSDCCPCCDFCRCERAKHRKDYFILILASIFICLIQVAFSIAGIIQQFQYTDSILQIKCQATKAVGDVQYGVPGYPWGGFTKLTSSLENVTLKLNDFVTQTNTQVKNIKIDNIKSSYQSLQSENQQINQINVQINGKQSYYVSQQALNYLVNGISTNQGQFVQNQQQSLVTNQTKVLETIYDGIINALQGVISNSTQIVNDQQSTTDAIDQSYSKINDASDNLIKYKSNIDDAIDNKQLRDAIQGVLLSFFGYALFVSLIVILALAFLLRDKNGCNICLCIGNWLFALIIFCGYLLCIYFSIQVTFQSQSCSFIYEVITVDTTLNQIDIDGDVKNISQTCLFGNGNLLSIYTNTSWLDSVNKLNNSINTFTNAASNYNTQLASGTSLLNNNKAFINKLATSVLVDEVEPSSYNSGSQNESFNVKFQMSTKLACSSGDQIVEFQNNCTSGNSFYDASTGQDFPSTIPLCIQSCAFFYKPSAMSSRLATCDSQSFNNVSSFLNTQNQGWKPVLNKQNQLIQDNQDVSNNLTQNVTALQTYVVSIQDYLKVTTDPTSGVLSQVNCSFVSKSIKRVSNAFCVDNLLVSYQIYIFIAMISTCMFISTFTLFRIYINVNNIKQFEKYSTQEAERHTDFQQVPLQEQHMQSINDPHIHVVEQAQPLPQSNLQPNQISQRVEYVYNSQQQQVQQQ